MSQKFIYVVPGWSEGSWHLKRLVSYLPNFGYEMTNQPKKADIIIAHSAGSYSLPEASPATILIINPPYWPGRSIVGRIFRNVILDIPGQIRQWGIGQLIVVRYQNTINALKHPIRHLKLWRAIHKRLLENSHSQTTLVVRNSHDAFCSPAVKDYCQKSGINYFELPGLHEDIWFNPRPYLELIKNHDGK